MCLHFCKSYCLYFFSGCFKRDFPWPPFVNAAARLHQKLPCCPTKVMECIRWICHYIFIQELNLIEKEYVYSINLRIFRTIVIFIEYLTFSACQPGRKVSSGPPSSPDPDLTVTSKTNYHVGSDESAPWTEQHAGCGRSGLGVKIPSDFFQFESVADANVTLSGGRKRFYKDTWELRHKGKNTN